MDILPSSNWSNWISGHNRLLENIIILTENLATGSTRTSDRRTDENDAITANEQHRYVASRRSNHLFVGVLVDFDRCQGLLDITLEGRAHTQKIAKISETCLRERSIGRLLVAD